jgi:hypothetical protein
MAYTPFTSTPLLPPLPLQPLLLWRPLHRPLVAEEKAMWQCHHLGIATHTDQC